MNIGSPHVRVLRPSEGVGLRRWETAVVVTSYVSGFPDPGKAGLSAVGGDSTRLWTSGTRRYELRRVIGSYRY